MKHSFTILLLSMVTLLASCTRGAKLNVVNQSSAELTDVLVSGTGFSQNLGSIQPGKQHSVSVTPTSESALKLEFNANGKHFTSAPQGYFEGSPSYKVTATVAPVFTVTVDTKIQSD
jgi:hypothetical protein